MVSPSSFVGKDVGEDIQAGGHGAAFGFHVGQERLVLGFKTGDRADAIGQQHDVRQALVAEVLHDVFRRCFHAVATGFARNQQQVALLQRGNDTRVHLGTGVRRVRNLGHQSRIMLRPGVGAFRYFVDHAQLQAFPLVVRVAHILMDRMAPRTDFAVHGPDHQRVAPLGLQRVEVGKNTGDGLRMAGKVFSLPDIESGDLREGIDRSAGRVHPEAGSFNTQKVVRIQRYRNVRKALDPLGNEFAQALHVRVGTGYGKGGRNGHGGLGRCVELGALIGKGQIAKIVLWVDDKQMDATFHGELLC